MGRLDSDVQALAIGLLNLADDDGLFPADPALINAALRPLKPARRLTEWLEVLRSVGWIELRTHTEQGVLGWVVNFTKHQRINRPSPSTLKDYWNASKFTESSVSPHGVLSEGSLLEGKGREGKGRESDGDVVKKRSKVKKPPAQQALPEIPPPPMPERAKSRQEESYDRYQVNRHFQLVKILGVDLVEDEPLGPAVINTALGQILKETDRLREKYPDAETMLPLDEQLFDKWFLNPWGAGRAPPFPFRAFASEKVWKRHLEELEKDLSADAAEMGGEEFAS